MRVSLIGYLKNNDHKKLTLAVWWLAGFYRLQMLVVPAKKLEKKWGEKGVESPMTETWFSYWYATKVSKEVYRITEHTPWESKCMVQALTARYLLHRKGIKTTMYLGVGYAEEKVVAHAWLRCGEMYVTGGDGSKYANVAKFCK